MQYHKTRLLVTVILASLVFVALAANRGIKAGEAFPDLTAFKLEGKLPDSFQDHVVFVDFWASWCGPCAKSFPVINDLHKTYKDRGVVFLAVNVDEKPEAMEKFLAKHKASFPVVRDIEQKLIAQLNVATMPTSFIVDRQGKVRFIHSGFHGEKTRQQYTEEIESLLKNP